MEEWRAQGIWYCVLQHLSQVLCSHWFFSLQESRENGVSTILGPFIGLGMELVGENKRIPWRLHVGIIAICVVAEKEQTSWPNFFRHGVSMFVDWTNDSLGMTGMETEHLRKYFCVKIFLRKNCRTGEGNIARMERFSGIALFLSVGDL